MGCGLSHEAIVNSDDLQKSIMFNKLISQELNPLATAMNQYFRDLLSECQYRSQGNTSGYERMLRTRKSQIIVNRSVNQARKQGINKQPLTTEAVRDIVELFLGYAILTLVQRQWSGSFDYNMEPASLSNITVSSSPNTAPMPHVVGATGTEDAAAPGEATGGAPAASALRDRGVFGNIGSGDNNRSSNSNQTDVLFSRRPPQGLAGDASMPSEDLPAPIALSEQRREGVSHGTLPSITIDDGHGVKTQLDKDNEMHLVLTGSIQYPTTDRRRQFECTCEALFVLYVCPPA